MIQRKSSKLGQQDIEVFCFLFKQNIKYNKQLLPSFLKNQYRFIAKLFLNYNSNSDNCRLGDQGIALIVQAELLFITDLSLVDNNINHQGVRQMGKCRWKDLKKIYLNKNPIKNAGVKELIKNKWKSLNHLDLSDIGLTDDGAKILAKGQWPKLHQFDLPQNHLTGQFCNHLIHKNWILFTNIFWVSRSDLDQFSGYLKNIKLHKLREVKLQKQRIEKRIANRQNRQAKRGNE